MKKFSILLFALLVVSTAWASNPDQLSSKGQELKPAKLAPAHPVRTLPHYPPDESPFRDRSGDSCDDPMIVNSFPYIYSGSTTDNGDTYGNAGPDEWHQFTITETRVVVIDLCNSVTAFDTYIHLLADDCSTEVASNDDGADCPESPAPYPPSQLEVELDPGTYILGIEGYDTEAGEYQVLISSEGGGDSCDDAFITELPYQYEGTTTDNTDTFGNPGPDEWHSFTLAEAALVVIDLCNEVTDYDTYLRLLADDCTTEVTSNDDGPECPASPAPYPPSSLEVELDAGTYVVGVEGYDEESGGYMLDIYVWEPPLYGTCQFPAHLPTDDWNAGTSHNDGGDVNYLRADRFGEAMPGMLTGVEIAGLSLIQDDGWFACEEDPMLFDLVFYEDGDLPGAVVAVHEIEASPVGTGDLYAGFELFEFYLELPDALELPYGWFSVQTSGECWYLWMSCPDVDGASAISESGGDWATYDFDLAWCLTVSEDVADTVEPLSVSLNDNYPNPFNPLTTIGYELTAPQQVELAVYNLTGERVVTLVNGAQNAGLHYVQFDGSELPSGIYFYQLIAGDFTRTNRMLLVK